MNTSILSMFFYSAPYLLIDVAGITYAAVEWKKHPRLSTMVIASLGALIAKTMLMNIIYRSPSLMGEMALFSVIRVADVLVGVCAHGLLIYAVFFGFGEGQKAVMERKTQF